MIDRRALLPLLAAPLLAVPALARAAPAATGPRIVAAENMYGDVAGQIAGPDASVTAILSNPDQDPHLFEASPSVARAIAGAQIAIYNGIGYDPWMEKLLAAAGTRAQRRISVAALLARSDGDNPHLWYDTAAVLALAAVLAETLAGTDPANAEAYRTRLAAFQTSMRPVQSRILALRARLAGTPVTATEPVFGYMIAALGMIDRNQDFQRAVMNGTEPSPAQIRDFEADLTQRRVRLLVHNSQATDPVAERLTKLAAAHGIPVIGTSETEPKGLTYQRWMMSMLDAVDRALPAA